MTKILSWKEEVKLNYKKKESKLKRNTRKTSRNTKRSWSEGLEV